MGVTKGALWVLVAALMFPATLRAGMDGVPRLVVPDTMPTINDAVREAMGTDKLLLRSGVHRVGEHMIKGGLFRNNAPAYMGDEVVVQKQLTIIGTAPNSPPSSPSPERILWEPWCCPCCAFACENMNLSIRPSVPPNRRARGNAGRSHRPPDAMQYFVLAGG